MANKIDAIGFACLISKVAATSGDEMYHGLVQDFHDLVLQSVIEPPVQQSQTVLCSQIDAMLLAIQENKKIEAIKTYRLITNSDLRIAKEAIEKYWYCHNLAKEATLGDILNTAVRQPQY